MENSIISFVPVFPISIFQLLPIITPLFLDQLTCSLPKNVTTFRGEQDGIIHFCLSPNERGVLALWIYIFNKKFMAFSKLDFSTSSYHNSTNTRPIVTNFHRKQDGIIHFCLSPNKRGVLALWIHIFTKKIMAFSKLDFSTSSYYNTWHVLYPKNLVYFIISIIFSYFFFQSMILAKFWKYKSFKLLLFHKSFLFVTIKLMVT